MRPYTLPTEKIRHFGLVVMGFDRRVHTTRPSMFCFSDLRPATRSKATAMVSTPTGCSAGATSCSEHNRIGASSSREAGGRANDQKGQGRTV